MNNVRLAGNLGKDPEIRTFEDGGKIANFSLATKEEYFTRNGERANSTSWHNITARGKIVERIQAALHKGSYVSIEGRLQNRSWVDKNGQKRYITEVVATAVNFDTAA